MRWRTLAISDRRSLPPQGEEGAAGLARWLRRLADAGIEAVQLREKDLSDGELYGLARQARSLLPPPAALLVNGRLDVALAAGADGVHLPADGVPVAPLRRRFGPGALIGCSTHSLEEVERARREGADYVTFGPVYPTPGKGPAAGPRALARAAGLGIPVFALGGVTLQRLEEVAAAGAAGVAGIRIFQGSLEELAAVVRSARRLFLSAPGAGGGSNEDGDGGRPT
jgi:thiamine-phosphate pyrophosphorylase